MKRFKFFGVVALAILGLVSCSAVGIKPDNKGTDKTLYSAAFNPGMIYTAQCFDKNGNLKWTASAHNIVTTLGKNYVLDAAFHGTTPKGTWYIGLVDDNPTFAAADTLASHSLWAENTEYTGDRKEWTEGAASAGSMTNAATVDFTMNAGGTLAGLFLCAAATGTAELLYSEVLFTGGDRTYISTDVIKVTATLTSADDGV